MADRTKLWISDSLKRLMASKPLERIRVTDVCREAGIGRPAFYYHFRDKYDLVAWTFCHAACETDVLSVRSSAEAVRRMKNDMVFYRRAYEDLSQNALWKYMVEYFVKRYTALAKERLGAAVPDAQLAYSIRFYCMGAVGMTQEWVLGDNITPAKTAVQLMFASMPEPMRRVFFEEA